MKQETLNVVERYKKLQEEANKQRDERLKLQGVLDNLKSTLKSRGFNSIGDAKRNLAEMRVKKLELEKSLESKILEFEKKYAEFL